MLVAGFELRVESAGGSTRALAVGWSGGVVMGKVCGSANAFAEDLDEPSLRN